MDASHVLDTSLILSAAKIIKAVRKRKKIRTILPGQADEKVYLIGGWVGPRMNAFDQEVWLYVCDRFGTRSRTEERASLMELAELHDYGLVKFVK